MRFWVLSTECGGFLTPLSVVSDADVSSETSDKPQRIWVEDFQVIDDPDTRPGYIKFQGYTKIPQILEVQIGDEVHLQCPDLADSPELRLLEAEGKLSLCKEENEVLCAAQDEQAIKIVNQVERFFFGVVDFNDY